MTVRLSLSTFACVAEPSPLCRLADHLLDGELAHRIEKWRAENRSWDSIARELAFETDRQIEVSGVTVQTWARQLDVPEPENAA